MNTSAKFDALFRDVSAGALSVKRLLSVSVLKVFWCNSLRGAPKQSCRRGVRRGWGYLCPTNLALITNEISRWVEKWSVMFSGVLPEILDLWAKNLFYNFRLGKSRNIYYLQKFLTDFNKWCLESKLIMLASYSMHAKIFGIIITFFLFGQKMFWPWNCTSKISPNVE